jgi:transcriptional regulator with XRE-family HTH domain
MNIRGAYGVKQAQTNPSSFGERLRRMRIAWGWTQGQLAEALGSNQRLVSHWERDIAKPSGAALTAISSLVGVSAEALLTGKDFTIPDMPAIVVGVAKETVAQYAALSRSLPKPKKGRVIAVDIDAYESKPLTLDEAIQALKDAKGPEQEVWVVVRSRKTSKKDQASQG